MSGRFLIGQQCPRCGHWSGGNAGKFELREVLTGERAGKLILVCSRDRTCFSTLDHPYFVTMHNGRRIAGRSPSPSSIAPQERSA